MRGLVSPEISMALLGVVPRSVLRPIWRTRRHVYGRVDLKSRNRKSQGLGSYLSRREAAEALRLKATTLRSWASRGIGPAFIKIGESRSARVLYAVEEVRRFLSDPIGYQPAEVFAKRRRGSPVRGPSASGGSSVRRSGGGEQKNG